MYGLCRLQGDHGIAGSAVRWRVARLAVPSRRRRKHGVLPAFLTTWIEKGCPVRHKLFCTTQLIPQHGSSLMSTECSQQTFDFQPLGSRQVTARFDGGTITSDGGGLLLRELEARTGIIRRLAAC